MDLLTAVTIGCGPSIYNADASTVAGSQESELEKVKNNFLIKKLGLVDGPELMDAINISPLNSQSVTAHISSISAGITKFADNRPLLGGDGLHG